MRKQSVPSVLLVTATLAVAAVVYAAEGDPSPPGTVDVKPFDPLVAMLVAACVAGIKRAALAFDTYVPDILKVGAVGVLSSFGTAACNWIDAACGGNPLTWSEQIAQTFVVGFLAIAVRTLVRIVYPKQGLVPVASSTARRHR